MNNIFRIKETFTLKKQNMYDYLFFVYLTSNLNLGELTPFRLIRLFYQTSQPKRKTKNGKWAKYIEDHVNTFLTSPNGFKASKCNVGNWIFSKSWEFFGNSLGIL